jgi:hypothetical protein
MLTSCDDDADRRRHLASERAKEELTLLTNMVVAGPEIARRIRERIQSDGSVIIIKNELLSSFHAMPSNVPWMASCSEAGLSITLGSGGESGAGVELTLSDAYLEEQTCKELVALTAAKVLEILAGK